MTSDVDARRETSDRDDVLAAPVALEWTPELTVRFWDYISQCALNDLSFSGLNGAYVKFVFQHFLDRGFRYLDFGGGSGHLAELFVDDGYKMGVFDPAGNRVVESLRLLEHRDGFLGFHKPGSDCEAFEGLFMIEVIEHVLDVELEETFQHIKDFLQPGGLLFITTPNQENLELGAAIDPVSGSKFHRWQHVRSWDKQSLSAMIERHGFEVVVMHEIEFSARAFDRGGADILHRAEFAQLFNTMRSIHLGDGSGLACVARLADRPKFAFSSRFPRLWTKVPAVHVPLKISADPPPCKDLAPLVADWHQSPDTIEIIVNPGLISSGDGFSWIYHLPAIAEGDSAEDGSLSETWLYEDGVPLGPAHSSHDSVRASGQGSFSHWHDTIVFSTSDNTSPITNGRQYTIRVKLALD